MNEQEKEVREAGPPKRGRSARRWLRALIAILDDLIAASLAGFIGATHGMVVSRIRRDKK